MTNKPKIVFFLGAGFSKSFDHRLPTGATMLDAVLEKLEEFPTTAKGIVTQAIDSVFTKSHNIAQSKYGGQDVFELFLGILEGLRLNAVDSRRILGSTDPNLVWELVVAAVGRAIRYEHPGYQNYHTGKLGYLIRIIEYCATKCSSVSIITTNYDLIADKAVTWQHDRWLGYKNRGVPEKDLRRFQYGVPIRGVWEIKGGKSSFVKGYRGWKPIKFGIPLYKLHGSMNWAYCEDCKELDLSFTREEVKEVFDTPKRACCANQKCGEPYNWLLVPPTTAKEYKNPLLKKIWSRAESALTDAHRVIFIGYSLPPADPIILQMLLRARAKSEKTNGKAWQYTVFDRCSNVHIRFESLFGPPECRPRPRNFDISSFARNWKKRSCEP